MPQHEGLGERDILLDRASQDAGPAGQDAGQLRILVVDDNFLIAFDTAEQLRSSLDAVVAMANSVPQALSLLQSDSGAEFDVAVMDLDFNGTSGIALAELLEEERLPFVFATGYTADHPLPERFRNVPLVTKPYRMSTLEEAIRTVLNARHFLGNTRVTGEREERSRRR